MKLPAHPIEESQVLQILRSIKTRTWHQARDRALIGLLWRTGIRNGELRHIAMDHISSSKPRHIRIMKPKGLERGAEPRNVGLDETVWGLLQDWIEFRGEQDRGFLFCTSQFGKLSGGNVRRMIKLRAKRAGITRRIHPHAFRHTFAKDLVSEGDSNLVVLQEALGHTNLNTTARYLQHIGCGEAVNVTSERQWSL